MRLSRYFMPVLKENPVDAQIVSHRLMLRAGMIKQSSAGIYAWEKVLAAGTPDEDSFPPNFHTLVSTALERQDI